MTKKEVQNRVLYKGKPIPFDQFVWNQKNHFLIKKKHVY